ncbi:hypothetical protein Bca4012_000616 [Brassica carinata]|uniref:Uncharacterized protein n=1 Tax=Brassica carinata TaxID=52824 RepID=A0A8X8BD08_BRACI|nr:hypothetical protein Bca52824_005374 [Brassica carinata]
MNTCQSQSPPSSSGRNQSRDAAELRPSAKKNQNGFHKRFNREIYSGGSTHKKQQPSTINLKNSEFQHARVDFFEDSNKREDATTFERKAKIHRDSDQESVEAEKNGGVDQTESG